MSLIRSFGYALYGIWHCINYERNMRIHLTAAAYVLVFSPFFSLSGTSYAILLILIGLVLALELLNTALEAAGNAISREKNPYIKILKDAAAAAVLIMAMVSVAVAVFLFWQPDAFLRIWSFFTEQPIWFLPLGIGTIAALLFIYRSPVQLARKFKKQS